MRIRSVRTIALLLLFAAGTALADGDWKMGPFGPYWEDNDWPEYTPMYWMEEFINRLDDDDDEIREWMLRNQYGNQFGNQSPYGSQYPYGNQSPYGIWSGSDPYYGWGSPGTAYPQYWQPNTPANPWINPWTNPWASPWTVPPYYNYPQSSSGGGGNEPGTADKESTAAPPAPVAPPTAPPAAAPPQVGASPQMAAPTPARRLPRLSREEYARMPRDAQRRYRRAMEQEYQAFVRQRPRGLLGSLPNLTPEEFFSMPPELQREYKRAFDREYAALQARQAWEREQRLRRRSLSRDRPGPNRPYR